MSSCLVVKRIAFKLLFFHNISVFWAVDPLFCAIIIYCKFDSAARFHGTGKVPPYPSVNKMAAPLPK